MSLKLVYVEQLEAIHDPRKSFYGKALVLEFSDGTKFLKSYDTLMCKIEAGELVYTPNGAHSWSYTTGRHLAEFSRQYGGNYGGKSSMADVKVMSQPDSLAYYNAIGRF